jgi:hypothetical protein
MSDEQTPEARAAFEAATRRVQELIRQQFKAERELQEAERSGDPERLLEAAFAFDEVRFDLVRAALEAGRWGDTAPWGITPARAASNLFAMARDARLAYRQAIEGCLTLAYDEDDDIRQRARAPLLRRGLVTDYELENFPPASVAAIVWDRYRAWDEASPLP